MLQVLEIVGLVLVVACIALFSWQIAVGVAGVLLIVVANIASIRPTRGGDQS